MQYHLSTWYADHVVGGSWTSVAHLCSRTVHYNTHRNDDKRWRSMDGCQLGGDFKKIRTKLACFFLPTKLKLLHRSARLDKDTGMLIQFPAKSFTFPNSPDRESLTSCQHGSELLSTKQNVLRATSSCTIRPLVTLHDRWMSGKLNAASCCRGQPPPTPPVPKWMWRFKVQSQIVLDIFTSL